MSSSTRGVVDLEVLEYRRSERLSGIFHAFCQVEHSHGFNIQHPCRSPLRSQKSPCLSAFPDRSSTVRGIKTATDDNLVGSVPRGYVLAKRPPSRSGPARGRDFALDPLGVADAACGNVFLHRRCIDTHRTLGPGHTTMPHPNAQMQLRMSRVKGHGSHGLLMAAANGAIKNQAHGSPANMEGGHDTSLICRPQYFL